jgi:hypothetical protein
MGSMNRTALSAVVIVARVWTLGLAQSPAQPDWSRVQDETNAALPSGGAARHEQPTRQRTARS